MSNILKSLVVLKHILSGGIFVVNGVTYGIDFQNNIIQKFRNETTQEDVWMIVDLRLKDFMDLCDKMTEEEYVSIVASLGLKKKEKCE